MIRQTYPLPGEVAMTHQMYPLPGEVAMTLQTCHLRGNIQGNRERCKIKVSDEKQCLSLGAFCKLQDNINKSKSIATTITLFSIAIN